MQTDFIIHDLKISIEEEAEALHSKVKSIFFPLLRSTDEEFT